MADQTKFSGSNILQGEVETFTRETVVSRIFDGDNYRGRCLYDARKHDNRVKLREAQAAITGFGNLIFAATFNNGRHVICGRSIVFIASGKDKLDPKSIITSIAVQGPLNPAIVLPRVDDGINHIYDGEISLGCFNSRNSDGFIFMYQPKQDDELGVDKSSNWTGFNGKTFVKPETPIKGIFDAQVGDDAFAVDLDERARLPLRKATPAVNELLSVSTNELARVRSQLQGLIAEEKNSRDEKLKVEEAKLDAIRKAMRQIGSDSEAKCNAISGKFAQSITTLESRCQQGQGRLVELQRTLQERLTQMVTTRLKDASVEDALTLAYSINAQVDEALVLQRNIGGNMLRVCETERAVQLKTGITEIGDIFRFHKVLRSIVKDGRFPPTYNLSASSHIPSKWSVVQVGEWLATIGLTELRDKFAKHKVGGDVLHEANVEWFLSEIDVSLEIHLALSTEINKLRAQDRVTDATFAS